MTVPSVPRADTRWINQFNSFGSSADPITRTVFGFSARLERTELESMYRHDWLARAIVDNLPMDATREWSKFISAKTDEGDTLEELTDSLDTRDKFLEAMTLSRLYGGSVIIMGAYDGQQLEEPLNEDRVNWFGFLLVLDRWQLFPRAWYRDPSHPKFGMPSHYLVQPITQGGATVMNFVIHESRVLRFDGGFLPVRLRLRNIGWSDSVLEPVYEALRQFGVAAQSGAALLEDFVTKIYKRADLPEKLQSGNLDQITTHLQLAAGQMAVHGITVIGPDDEIKKEGTPTNGLFRMHQQFVDYVSGAAKQPKSRLFGNASGVLGSSSADADLRTWYDQVRAFQVNELTEKLKTVARLKAKAENVKLSNDWDLEWRPLWQLSEIDKSQIAVNYSQAHANWVGIGVLEPEEIAESVFGGEGIDFENINLDPEMRERLAAQPEPGQLEDLDNRMGELEDLRQATEGGSTLP